MKFLPILFLIFFCVNSYAADVHQCIAIAGNLSCKEEIALVCPAGFQDGCLIGNSKKHECVAVKGARPCIEEIALVCPAGFRDGCLIGKSEKHECVAVKGTVPCTREIALVCPSGFRDACLTKDPTQDQESTGDSSSVKRVQ